MDELKPDAKELLRIARSARSPDEDDRARMERRIALAIGAVAAGAATGASSAASAGTGAAAAAASSGAGASGLALKIGGALVCVALLGVGGWLAIRPADPVPAPVQAPVARATPTIAAPTLPLDLEERVEETVEETVEDATPIPTAAPSAGARPRRPSTEPGPDLAAEVELLHRAQGAWRAGDGALTLALVSEHESRFARSQLRPERTALRILALCALERDEEARRLATRFLRTAPSSPLRRSVEESCASTP